MCVQLLIVFVTIIGRMFSAEIGELCVAPNNELAQCVLVSKCSVIYHAFPTKSTSSSVAEFIRHSQCGYDEEHDEALVCCGSWAYFLPATATTASYEGLFTKAPKHETVQHNITLRNFKTTALPDRTVCGLQKDGERIVGGEYTGLGEFPWMAALEYKYKSTGKNAGIKCGGSLINNRYVVTAAHCIMNNEFELFSVWLGEWNISSNPDCTYFTAKKDCADDVKKLRIEETFPHAFYGTIPRDNDIGLLRLAEDIEFTDYIRPICLPPENLPNPQPGTLMTVSGWGITENNVTSDCKLKVDVPIINSRICRSKLGKHINSNQLCAGGELGRDACRGDSGGPIMRIFKDALSTQPQWYLEGVVSAGLGCGYTGLPAIYNRVSRYVKWIVDTISKVN